MNVQKSFLVFFVFLLITSAMLGCMITRQHRYSSVVQYLYPDQKEPVETPEIPVLALPLKVGIAFVPEDATTNQSFSLPELRNLSLPGSEALTERDKLALMKEISAHFKQYDFVKFIELIPSAYLRPQGSFANLDQIRTMFGIDVIALISYDQTQFTHEGLASITYWTLVGAYAVPGEKNDTHTMVDAAVYHVKSRKMLFRAPGISYIKGKATPVNLSEQLRIDSLKGFQDASKELVINLDEQLELFKEKVKESPQEFQVVHKPGYTGGGSLDISFLLIVFALGISSLWELRKRKE